MSNLIDFVNFSQETKLQFKKFISLKTFGEINENLWDTKNLKFYFLKK